MKILFSVVGFFFSASHSLVGNDCASTLNEAFEGNEYYWNRGVAAV
ncbi:hypothetical protein AB6A23_00760 [Paenibacillus tarimensis]